MSSGPPAPDGPGAGPGSLATNRAGRFSCVVDDHPRFHLDAVRWFVSLTELADVTPSDLVVHVVGDDRSDALDLLRSHGVTVDRVDCFDVRSPHCNKISGALRLAERPVEGMAVLCDTDIVVFEDPRRLALPPGTVGGKPVDAPLPPLDVLRTVFAAAQVAEPAAVPLPWGPAAETLAGNSNGGLYLVPGPLLPRVAAAWAARATWLLDRLELLHEWSIYVDQVAMALALAGEGIATEPLDARWNTPIHDPGRIPVDPPVPAIIHYHQDVDRHGFLRITGREAIDDRIRRVNSAVGDCWQRQMPSATYRRWLDTLGPTGAVPPVDRSIADIVAMVADALGSDGVLQLDRGAAPPDGSDHDLVVCPELDHRSGPSGTIAADIERLWRASRRALLVARTEGPVGGHEADGTESLVSLVRQSTPDAEVYPLVSSGRPLALAIRRPATIHPRDYGPTTLDHLVDRHPDPLALAALRIDAWRTIRFYPDHAPRLWEYPVVAQLVRSVLAPGSRLVDIGAGTTPLVPFLTRHGYEIDTVDPSTILRTWPPRDDWNEWGFLDYASAGFAHRSWNSTLQELPPLPLFDGMFSVSVIEHVPGDVRRSILAEVARRTRPGGLVVLTVDLVRGRDDLWNRNLGEQVEDPAVHGTLAGIVAECGAVGLDLEATETVRNWGTSEIDIALLHLSRNEQPAPPPAPRPAEVGRNGLRSLLREPRRLRSILGGAPTRGGAGQ